jgi:uncharacterized membrane protein
VSKQIRWLRDQTDVWVGQGVVSAEQAARIRALYPEPAAGLPWAMLVFSGLGAVIVGLGVILLFAYNWDALPRGVKLAVIFAALVAAHGAGVWRLRQADRLRALGEVLCLLGTMMYGAAIWLIAQIYHIEEHFPNGFLFWGLGALALAWALPSTLQGLLAAVVLAIWSGSEAVGFDAPVFWAPLFLLAILGTLAWRRESVLLLFVTLAATGVAALINAGAVRGDLVLRTALGLGATFVAVGALARQTGWFREAAWVWPALGWAQVLFPVYLLSFQGLTHELLGYQEYRVSGRDYTWYACLWTPLVLAVAAWAAVVAGRAAKAPGPQTPAGHYEDAVAPLAAAMTVAFAYVPLERSDWLAAGLFNLLFLLLAVAWMARGCRDGRLQPALGGALMFVALAAARYFDLFESLAARGLVFLLVGAGLFATGLQYTRTKKRLEAAKGGPS